MFTEVRESSPPLKGDRRLVKRKPGAVRSSISKMVDLSAESYRIDKKCARTCICWYGTGTEKKSTVVVLIKVLL